MPALPNPAIARRAAGPWILIEVPMDDADWLYPSKRRYYGKDGAVENLNRAVHFTVLKEAQRTANRRMYRARNVWCEPIPFTIAWAITNASTAEWQTQVPKAVSSTYGPKVQA